MGVYLEDDDPACSECFAPLAEAVYVSAMKPDMPICFSCFVLALMPVKVKPLLATMVIQ